MDFNQEVLASDLILQITYSEIPYKVQVSL
jgi:hypothetical protein